MINHYIKELYIQYFAEVGLKVNIDKNEHIVISTSPRTDMNFTIAGRAEKDKVKLLGLTFKAGWNTEPHVNQLSSRTSFRMAGLARIKPYISKKHLARLLDALVMSPLRYALELTATSRKCLYKLQQIQNRALRMATGSLKGEKISDMLSETKWYSVTNLMRLQQIKLVKTIRENKTCQLCSELILIKEEERQLQQELHRLRLQELRIAWEPRGTRTAKASSWYQMVRTYNLCNMFNKQLPKTKQSQNKAIIDTILQKFGRSHKP